MRYTKKPPIGAPIAVSVAAQTETGEQSVAGNHRADVALATAEHELVGARAAIEHDITTIDSLIDLSESYFETLIRARTCQDASNIDVVARAHAGAVLALIDRGELGLIGRWTRVVRSSTEIAPLLLAATGDGRWLRGAATNLPTSLTIAIGQLANALDAGVRRPTSESAQAACDELATAIYRFAKARVSLEVIRNRLAHSSVSVDTDRSDVADGCGDQAAVGGLADAAGVLRLCLTDLESAGSQKPNVEIDPSTTGKRW